MKKKQIFNYEYTATGEINLEKAWLFLCNVNFWKEWDEDIQEVILEGAFFRGNNGVMKMKNNQIIPFVIENVAVKESFAVSVRTDGFIAIFSHILAEDAITIKIVIEGLNKEYITQIGNKMIPSVIKSVNNLFALVKAN